MSPYVLVTGGAGYIGSHLCKALANSGYIPIVYDSLVTGHKSAVKWGPFIKGDILNEPLLIQTLKRFSPLAVFHLAGYSDARESMQNPLSYYENNVIGTCSLLRALLKHPVPYFIFSSSAAVYGEGGSPLLKEDSRALPITPYGRTKLAIEKMIGDFSKENKVLYANLRYFNAAGADLEGETGEAHDPETHLIPLLIQVLQKKKGHFSLLKDSHATKDGTAVRDFIHVEDLAAGHIQALDYLIKYKKSITLNLGSEKGHSILEIISSLQKKTNKTIPIAKSIAVDEPSSLIADASLAKELIGFSPQHSLDTILETALRWHS
jgi:UDP-arabinose 4-epimerase